MEPTKTISRAVYQAVDPSMSDPALLLDGRGDLSNPVVIWVKAINRNQWKRCSPIVELSVARRWQQIWARDGRAVVITPAYKISRTIQLPVF